MDCNSSAKMKDSRTPTLPRGKTSEKQTEAEVCVTKQVFFSRQKGLPKPGLPLEKKVEQEKRWRHVLIDEHNRLTLAMKEKEAKLKELEELLKAKNLQPTNYNNEDTYKQRIRQLENNLDKMRMKITKAKDIQTTYQHIHGHLQQEVCGMHKVLDQKQHAVAIGQAEVDKANKQFQSAAAVADGTLGRMAQMEYETMGKKREMDHELYKLGAEEKEMKRQMETLQHLSPTGQSKLKEQEIEEEGVETHDIPVTDHQCYDVCGALLSDMKVVKDMEALREALGCADVQELVNKVVSQRATKEQLLIEVTQHEQLARREARTLADLELQFTELKFRAKPAATRFDKLKGQMQAKLNQEMGHVQQLQAKLRQSQDLLDTVEQGVNNLYFRMSCIPVEVLSASASSADRMDKLRDISARLPTLLQRAFEQRPESSSQSPETVYSLLEQLNRTESRNNKRLTTPIQTPELSDDEEVLFIP